MTPADSALRARLEALAKEWETPPPKVVDPHIPAWAPQPAYLLAEYAARRLRDLLDPPKGGTSPDDAELRAREQERSEIESLEAQAEAEEEAAEKARDQAEEDRAREEENATSGPEG